uniref:Fe2OG dioxygenase domain-containing protein n=1 Tax=Chromera velia CCMP2878 TaxID=1169474 RepID=A0A0G4H839_9ALVE|eukprot:Cvel_5848.t1-p1 / transcript=Cvel_5848.t1 / gene=Cvel_5848 / organism=Chromera_velia_CCMP2878 / gene_product=hypothetical protein / transcript_product=hypothetical protein / location=Cvel_scaffold278:25327-26601(-) / protein_length=425 / sequence_SO=supercontig / SO=protein_coding / is_pseudo=false
MKREGSQKDEEKGSLCPALKKKRGQDKDSVEQEGSSMLRGAQQWRSRASLMSATSKVLSSLPPSQKLTVASLSRRVLEHLGRPGFAVDSHAVRVAVGTTAKAEGGSRIVRPEGPSTCVVPDISTLWETETEKNRSGTQTSDAQPALVLGHTEIAERLQRAFTAARIRELGSRGIVRLPSVLSVQEAKTLALHCAKSTGLAVPEGDGAGKEAHQKKSGKVSFKLLRESTGNGKNGMYAYLRPLPKTVQSLKASLRSLLESDSFSAALPSKPPDSSQRSTADNSSPGNPVAPQATNRKPSHRSDLQQQSSSEGVQTAGPTHDIFLSYGLGGMNFAHQDQSSFPFQALLCLSSPGEDFTGGSLFVVDAALPLQERRECPFQSAGDLVVFSSNCRGPGGGDMFHGMTEVKEGRRGRGACNRLAIGLNFV